MKKLISCLLVLTMMLSMAVALTGCGETKEESDGKITVYGLNSIDGSRMDVFDYYHNLWQQNSELPLDFVGGDFAMLMSSGDFPDVVMRGGTQNAEVVKYASQGVYIPLDEYINKKDTPNIWKMFEEHPEAKATATAPDGRIYGLPMFNNDPSQGYVETYWYINKTWLDKLDLEIPSTLDELRVVLEAFKTGDPNGNGKADEIPMGLYNDSAFAFPEVFLTCWGLATKGGTFDAYLAVQDGEVKFTPMLDEYKKMVKYLSDLYKDGLLDIETFTYTAAVFNSKLASETPVFGVLTQDTNRFGPSKDEYVVIPPLSAEGNKPAIRLHPGILGYKNMVHITASCKEPATAMKWIDSFYDVDNTIINWFGANSLTKEGDVYKWNQPEEGQSIAEMCANNTVRLSNMAGYLPKENIGTKLEDCEMFSAARDNYLMYEDYLAPESWTRPYYEEADAARLAIIQTDLFNYIEQMKADWIMGKSDVEADWDKYQEQLKKLNVEEFLTINQKAHDVYMNAMK